MNDQLFSPSRASFIQTMRRKFLRTLKTTELSVKVITGWRSGDFFVGAKRAADAIDDDPDVIQQGGRRWGGGNGFGEGFVRYDPIEIEAFRRKQLRCEDSEPAACAGESNDDDDKSVISDEQARKEAFLWERGDLSYPFCCFKARRRTAAGLWLAHVILGLAFFAAGIYFSIVNLNWAGMPAWCYMVFAGVLLMAPIMSWLLVLATIKLVSELVAKVLNPKMPERAEPMLNLLFLIEKMSFDLVVLLTYFWYTIAFLLLFANHPKDQMPWVNAYRYLTAVLGTLTVYSLGSVFAQYLTHTITKEVNVHSLGNKLRSVLRAEVALWRILEVVPADEDFKLYRLMEDPFLTYDPKKAADLARALVKTPMNGIYKRQRPGSTSQKVEIRVESDRDASLLGSWAYASLMKATHRSSYLLGAGLGQSKLPVMRRMSSWRSGGSGSGTHLDAIISDYYSPEERALSTFKRIHKRTVEQYQGMVRDAQLGGFNLAYKVFAHLDLAMPLEFLRPGIETAAAEEPWSKQGIVRGVPKRFVTKEDLDAALKLYESDLAGLPKINATAVWDFFDPEHVGRVALKRAKLAVKGLVQDRKNLKTTLENTSQVVKKLRSVISTGLNFFVFLCALAIFGLDVLEVWVGISSIVLAFSFVFGGTLKGVFDAVVFLFGVHPYDVGDKIKLGPQEDVYWVKRISLMSTQMTRWDGASVRFMNQYLFGVYPLINVRRSGNHEKTLSIFVDAASLPSRSELEKIQFEFEQFLARLPGSFTGSCSVTARDIIQPLHVKITIWWGFAYPDLDSGRTYRDTSKVIQFLLAAFRKRQVKVSGVNSGQIDLDKGGSKKVVGLQGGPGTTRII